MEGNQDMADRLPTPPTSDETLAEISLAGLAPPARAAHDHLLAIAATMNLSAEPRRSAVTAIKLCDAERRYLFSWIINKAHLLFYIRKPALDIMPSLKPQAMQRLHGVAINNGGEVTIRLETLRDATMLTDWLFARETWSEPGAPRELTKQKSIT